MRIKSAPVRIKAAGEHEGVEDGTFEAIVAAYNTDSVGDRITPGAFAETLAEWRGKGDPIPVLWSHLASDPDYHIGVVEEAEERPEGLWVRARLDMDGPKARQVYRLLKGRRVTQFSFAYDIQEGSWVDQPQGESYYELRRLKLYEVGPTLIGANQATELLDIKSGDRPLRLSVDGASPGDTALIRTAVEAALGAKAGRALSRKNETTLRSALERVQAAAADLDEVLAAVASEDNDEADDESADTSNDEKATPDAPATSEEPSGAKEDRPARPGAASLRLRADLDEFEVSMLTE